MTLERHQFEIGLCPSPGKQIGQEWRTPVDMQTSYDEETNRLTVTMYLLEQGHIKPDQVLTVYLCPVGRICGCYYQASVAWEILSSCGAEFYWTWPLAARCLLKSGSLTGSESGLQYIGFLAEDPGWPIYPVGDDRNPDCPGCGMAGGERDVVCDAPLPGERFSLTACIDEETCLLLFGTGGCHPIGEVLFQTVGFMGGQIHDVFDEEQRIYEVMVDGTLTGAQGTDLTKYNIGDWVALAKIDTEFPVNEDEQRVPVTDTNVPEVGIEEYIIIPYQFVGKA